MKAGLIERGRLAHPQPGGGAAVFVSDGTAHPVDDSNSYRAIGMLLAAAMRAIVESCLVTASRRESSSVCN